MSHLVPVNPLRSEAVRQGKTPVMMEFSVNPELAPFLVTSSTGMLWVGEAHPGNIVKAAVRPIPDLGEFFRDAVDAVAALGQGAQWGNVHPLTPEGLDAAIEHVTFYDLPDLELLIPIPPKVQEGETKPPKPFWRSAGIPIRPTSWLPQDCLVVVPKNRDYVGMVGRLTPKAYVGVIHNASRSLGIVRGTPPEEIATEIP